VYHDHDLDCLRFLYLWLSFLQGTAFYALQSCANHSCSPNAQAAGDFSGGMHVIAAKDISPGEEIVISYIDETADYEDRQAMLEDYGFMCKCTKCSDEKAALAAAEAEGAA
jgi:hypothetical protein